MEQQEIDELKAWRSRNQVTSVNQFSDIRPTDWAYQALTNLVEKYGCVAGYPNGTYKGGQAMTRYEAAALLNACLDRVTEVTDELQRLMDEFKKELAVLKGRVDGVEAKVGSKEAQQFSTTTKLKGEVNFILGGVPDYNSDTSGRQDRTTFNYDLRLNLDTSFTGKDLLKTRLRSDNFTASSTNAGASGPGGIDTVSIDHLYYQFPVGKQFMLTAGCPGAQHSNSRLYSHCLPLPAARLLRRGWHPWCIQQSDRPGIWRCLEATGSKRAGLLERLAQLHRPGW